MSFLLGWFSKFQNESFIINWCPFGSFAEGVSCPIWVASKFSNSTPHTVTKHPRRSVLLFRVSLNLILTSRLKLTDPLQRNQSNNQKERSVGIIYSGSKFQINLMSFHTKKPKLSLSGWCANCSVTVAEFVLISLMRWRETPPKEFGRDTHL